MVNDKATKRQDAAAYALDAMSPSERAAFEANLDEATAQQVRDDRETLSLLGGAVTPVAPPADLKAKLLQQIKHTPQEQPVMPFAQVPHERPAKTATAGSEVIDPLVAPTSRAQRTAQQRWSNTWRNLALAGAAAAVIAGGWGFTQYQQLQHARSEITALQQEAGQASLVDQISMAEDVSLAKGSMDGSNISVVYSPSHNMASISTAGLPKLPEGKAYMIWLYDAQGTIVGSGTLNNGSVGEVFTEMTSQDLSQVTDFGITVEDATATAPSEKPMMLDVMKN